MPGSTGRSFENRIERPFLSEQLGIIRGFEGTSKAGQVFTQKEFGIGQQPLLTRCRFHKSFAYVEGEGKSPASENRIKLRQPHFSQLNTNVGPLDHITAMGLFDRFRKRNDEAKVPPSSGPALPSICYRIAYFVLPHYAFKDCEKLVTMFTGTPASAGPFFYLMGCQMLKTEPIPEDARRFQSHHGELDAAQDYFVLEYPTPPAFDLSDTDPTQLSPERMPVLAPHFSAIVRHRQTREVSYYTLGQAPIGGGTTLRTVAPDGANSNLGPGPEPRLDGFLARLRNSG